MAPPVSKLDWSLAQVFLAVAEHGSLSRAARELGATQPTVGRKIKMMEEQLGIELFRRHDKGLALTEVGGALLSPARAMRDAVHRMELKAVGQGDELAGTVRITASVAVATHHLPLMIAELRREHREITIELDPSDESSNLHFRQADIAVRMYRPSQLDLVTQHLGELEVGIFATRGYVEARGVPRTLEELLDHDVLGLDRGTVILEGFAQGGFPVEREWFKVRCDNYATYWELLRAGAGIGFVQRLVGAAEPDLVEISLPLGLPRFPIWLTAHDAIRRMPRVDVVWMHLAAALRELCARTQECTEEEGEDVRTE